MSGIVDQVLGAPAWLVLTIVGLVVFAEDALFVGFIIPGETVAILGGVAANRGHVPLVTVILIVIVAGVTGDSVGYEVGRHLGPRLLRWHILDRHRERVEDAQNFLARRGGTAVLLGRWVAFFRAVMPALAGTAQMPYPKFLAFNATGGILWGTTVVVAGYLVGASYVQIETTIGSDGALIVAAIALAALLAWRIRKHRASTQNNPEQERCPPMSGRDQGTARSYPQSRIPQPGGSGRAPAGRLSAGLTHADRCRSGRPCEYRNRRVLYAVATRAGPGFPIRA